MNFWLTIVATLLIVTNGVWAFVMYDFQQKKEKLLYQKSQQKKIIQTQETLLELAAHESCISNGDVWKLFSSQGVKRVEPTYWEFGPYSFRFTAAGCLMYEQPEIEEDSHKQIAVEYEKYKKWKKEQEAKEGKKDEKGKDKEGKDKGKDKGKGDKGH